MNAKKILFTWVVLCHIPFWASAVYIFPASGFASVNGNNLISVNPALAACEHKSLLAFSGSNLYGMKDLMHLNATAVFPMQHAAMGFRIEHFGNGLFSRQNTSAIIAYQANKDLGFGLCGTYNRMSVKAYGSNENLSMDAGIFAKISPVLSSGFLIQGLMRRADPKSGLLFSDLYSFWGITYQIDKKIKWIAEIEKHSGNRFSLQIAMIYSPDTSFNINLSFSGQFREISLGLLHRKKQFVSGITINTHVILGISSSIHLAYVIKK